MSKNPVTLFGKKDLLNPMKGKAVMEKGGMHRKCPIHPLVHGKQTNWSPPSGLDPNLREFWCDVYGEEHAFYVSCPPKEETDEGE